MIIEFTVDVPGVAAKGAIVDMLDGAARAFTEAGQARPSDITRMMDISLEAKLKAEREAFKKDLDELRGLQRNVPARAPGGDPGVAANGEIRPGEASADRDPAGRSGDKSRNIGDITRCIWLQRSDEPAARQYATQRLEKSYGLTRTQWQDPNEVTGEKWGIERTGTESMTGAATYGYLIPPTFIQDVLRVMSEESVVTGYKSVPIGAGVDAKYPALDQFGTTTGGKRSNYHAGVQLYRVTETQQRTASDAALNELDFKVTDLTGFTKVSRNAMADSWYPLGTFLMDIFAQAFTWRDDFDYLWGNGAGEPLGILSDNNAALVKGGGVSGNASRTTANQILYADLAWMLSKLHPNCWGGAYWVAHLSTLPYLIGVQSAAGTFVYQPNSMISQADRPTIYGPGRFQGTLLGFPVRFTEKASSLGTAGDLNLICPQMFGVADKAGIEVGMSEHFLFDTDQIAIRWKRRNDAKPLWRKYFTDYQGTTSSPFVQLV